MAVTKKPGLHSNIAYALTRLDGKACGLFYVVGLAWFLALNHHSLNSSTYLSENALLPGLVDSEFFHDHGADAIHNEMSRLLTDRESTDEMYQIPSDWLLGKFRSLGIDSYTQNYSFSYPYGVYDDRNLSGQNIYGILRAPRTSGMEALVLSVPFRPDLSGHDATYPGLALMLGLAKAFRRHSYWAKDIIFLVTDNEGVGMEAWLSSYHHIPNKYISAGVLPSRSGSIQAAINLEMASKTINRVDVKFEGINGKLPNLDLINTVERLFSKEGLRITIQNKARDRAINEWSRYVHSLKTMLSMVWHQAPGTPTGNHGFFHKYNIEAVTVHATKVKGKKVFEVYDIGRAVEGIFRSLNNLLERFHQSFFFYLLPSPHTYISIGVYMPPLGVMLLPVIIKVLTAWLNFCSASTKDEQKSKDGAALQVPDSETEKKEEVTSPNDELMTTDENKEAGTHPEPLDKITHMAVFVMSALLGIGSHYSADFFVRSTKNFGVAKEEGLSIGLVVIHLVAIMQPYFYRWRMRRKFGENFTLDRNLLNCFTLLIFGISLGTISVMNISMAFLVAVAWVPVVLINHSTHSWLLTLMKYLIVILASPISLLFIGGVIGQILTNQKDDALIVASKAWIDVQDGLMLSSFQFYLHNNWTFSLLNFVFLPIWSLFWFVATVNN